jgi:hypothetical protein
VFFSCALQTFIISSNIRRFNMPDYSLVPVDYQPDFDDYSLVPVDYDPFAGDGPVQQAQFQQPPTPTPPAQPQPQTQPQQPATAAGQPGVNGPATGNSPGGSGGGAASAMQEVVQATRLRLKGLGLKAGHPSLLPMTASPIRHQRSF